MNSLKKKIVGITGTNGKTSVAHYLTQILALQGEPVLTIGTLGACIGGKKVKDTGLTTPSYPCLREIFLKHGHQFSTAIIEVSSHGLEQGRLGDIKLDVALWTNFTQDHLDYHSTMDNYFCAKEKIFNYLTPVAKLILLDEEKEIACRLQEKNRSRVLWANNLSSAPFEGFIQKNVALAQKGAEVLGYRGNVELSSLNHPQGRFDIVAQGEKTVIVDYAHTPSALESLLQLVRNKFKDKKVHLLFGCGGERDTSKRALMGDKALAGADKIYLTSDNPRGECPHQILKEIKSTFPPDSPVIENADRLHLLQLALSKLKKDAVLVVAGKGHEDYQEIKGTRHPFNEFQIIREFLNHA